MNKKQFVKKLKEDGAKVVHEFRNEHGEDFVLYQYPEMTAVMVSGDEFDWEMGWMMQKGDHKEALQIFQFSMEEGTQLMKFWNKEFEKEQDRFQSTHRPRKKGVGGIAPDTRKAKDVGNKSTEDKVKKDKKS